MCLRRNQTGETELNETEQTGKNCFESDDESCYTPHFSAEVDLIGIFLAFLIVVLNTMVFILVAKKRSLRTTTTEFPDRPGSQRFIYLFIYLASPS